MQGQPSNCDPSSRNSHIPKRVEVVKGVRCSHQDILQHALKTQDKILITAKHAFRSPFVVVIALQGSSNSRSSNSRSSNGSSTGSSILHFVVLIILAVAVLVVVVVVFVVFLIFVFACSSVSRRRAGGGGFKAPRSGSSCNTDVLGSNSLN